MSQTDAFIADLFRAANEVGKLSIDERRRIVDRAVGLARELRIEAGVRPSRGHNDALREIEIAALLAEAGGNHDDVKAVLLDLADMVTKLNIASDGKTK